MDNNERRVRSTTDTTDSTGRTVVVPAGMTGTVLSVDFENSIDGIPEALVRFDNGVELSSPADDFEPVE